MKSRGGILLTSASWHDESRLCIVPVMTFVTNQFKHWHGLVFPSTFVCFKNIKELLFFTLIFPFRKIYGLKVSVSCSSFVDFATAYVIVYLFLLNKLYMFLCVVPPCPLPVTRCLSPCRCLLVFFFSYCDFFFHLQEMPLTLLIL